MKIVFKYKYIRISLINFNNCNFAFNDMSIITGDHGDAIKMTKQSINLLEFSSIQDLCIIV